MKILKFSAENFKRISVVEIRPDGNLVQITGKNGSGKTSCLDAIWATLEGAEHLQSVPIRKGADKATLQLTLGGDKVELIATRTIRKRKDEEGFNTTLTVETAEGFRAPSPQKAMDDLMGRITMDPLAFTRMKPKEQFDAMRSFVPGIDFDDLAAKNKSDYAKRTEVNRDAKRARTAADMVEVPDSVDAETQPVDEAALTEELAKAGQHNAAIETRKLRRAQTQSMIDDEAKDLAKIEADKDTSLQNTANRHAVTIQGLEDELERIKALIAGARANAAADETKIIQDFTAAANRVRTKNQEARAALASAEPLAEPIDVEALIALITTARWTNAAIQARDERAKHLAEAERLEDEAKALTDAMAAREKQKADAIAQAELPVEGLGFGDGVVTIDGLPFDQASDAQQLRTSIAIAIATAGKLRVIRVRDGSLLDDDGMALLAEMADKADMQIWIEKVANDGKVGFVLVDGHLEGHPPPDEPEEPEEKKPRGGKAPRGKPSDVKLPGDLF